VARWIYTLIFTLLMPLVLIRLGLRARKAPAYGRRIPERFGVFKGPAQKGGYWFHTVSVGEFLAAAPLIEDIMAAQPGVPITITCMTPTGSEQIRQRFADKLGKQVFHVYLPYDLPILLRGFLKRVRPQWLVIVETELWPNLIATSQRFGVKVMVANARLSERSAKGYAKVGALTKDMLERIDVLAVQNSVDGARFLALGMPQANMNVTGSIKFDIEVDDAVKAAALEWKQKWGAQRKVIAVASTHLGEDEVALDALSEVANTIPDVVMIIVPRHPERFDQVAKLIQDRGWQLRRRSQQNVDADTQVLLVDSMGEMMTFLACADVCLMGGSFVENGGHNPLEPAALSIPVVMGESQFNFALICEQLEAAGGLVTVSPKDVGGQLLAWLESDALRARHGACGLAVVKENQGAKQKVKDLILALADSN